MLAALAATILLGVASPAEEPKSSPPSIICYDIIDLDRKIVIVICIYEIEESDEEVQKPKYEL